jgi:flagellar M-ring protein FliF
VSEPKNELLERARAVVTRGRTWFGAASKPVRVLVVSTLVAVALVLAYVGYAANNEPYSALYTNLERDDAGAVVAKLKESKVPYRLSSDGTTVEVPTSRVQETRLELAAAGLPHGGGVGFESLDKMRLGATDFEQKVLYRRALEGELGRTVASLSAVESARVHLVMPEKSVFVSKRDPASASIVVKMRPGRTLDHDEVAGVVNLVAASVPGLTPDQIALVTTQGKMLHHPKRNTGVDGLGGGAGLATDDPDAFLLKQANEGAMEERVRQMLERVVGPGHADVRVSLELDNSRVERIEDHYDPTKTVVRSSDETVERSTDTTSATGVPGAESNTPQGAAPAAGGATGPAVVRQSTTRNFEIDHVSEKRIALGGGVRRMTVAVVVDGVPAPEDKTRSIPRSKEEVETLRALVAAAVGTDEKRGDVVTVESVPFVEGELLDASGASADAPATSAAVPAFLKGRNGKIAAGAAALVLVVALALATRSRRKAARAKALLEAKAKADAEAEAEAKEKAASNMVLQPAGSVAELPEGADPREEAMALAARDAATAAIVLRAWLGAQETAAAPATEPGTALALE